MSPRSINPDQITSDDLPVDFGRYTLTRILGEGGMARVFLGNLTGKSGFTKKVAIKVLHGGAASGEILTRFRHEAEAAARIGHAHIVDVLDYNTLPSGEPYIVMEHLEGEPLSACLARGAVDVDEVIRLTRQIGLALHAAHREGVVHRDLKPDNIFLCRTDGPPTVKVLDFGIAKFVYDSTRDGRFVTNSDMYETSVVDGPSGPLVGTACYMAPEYIMGTDLDGRHAAQDARKRTMLEEPWRS